MNTLKKSIKLKLYTKEFWILIVIYVVLLFTMEAPINVNGTEKSLFYMIINYKKQEMLQFGEMISAYNIIINIRSYKWYVLILPVLSAYMGALTFEANYLNGIYQYAVVRTTRQKYAMENLVEAGFFCVIVNVLGVSLFTGITYLMFPSFSDFGLTSQESMIAFFYGTSKSLRIIRYFQMLMSILLVSLLNTEIVIAGVLLCRDVFFGNSIPMILSYLGYMFINLQQTRLIDMYGFDFPMRKLCIQILNPAYLIEMENSYTDIFLFPLWTYYVGFTGAIVVIGVGEIVWIARRKKIE